MGWLLPVGPAGIFRPSEALSSALDAFDAEMGDELRHPAFNTLGSITVKKADVLRWAPLWGLGKLDAVEKSSGWQLLAGSTANKTRRSGLAYVKWVSSQVEKTDVNAIRAAMAEPASADDQSEFAPVAATWRKLQLRQLFRLSLESWFHWLILSLAGSPPRTTKFLTLKFLEEAGASKDALASAWLRSDAEQNPVPLIGAIQAAQSGNSAQSVPEAVCEALRCCMREGLSQPIPLRGTDRLPLRKAADDFSRWSNLTTADCAAQMIERWLLAQHAYWCVGRGLADAQGGGRTILRLRVVMEEGGWTLTPGTRIPGPPAPTEDRLATALNLMRECGAI